MKIIPIIIILILSFNNSSSHATVQAKEKMLFQGKTYDLLNYPMDRYFGINKDKKPKVFVKSSAINRGYIGTYEFKNKVLVLKDMKSLQKKMIKDEDRPYELKSIMTNLVSNGEPLKLDWYSGILHLGYGEKKPIPRSFSMSYSKHILIAVKNGKINGLRRFTGNAVNTFYKNRYELYKQSDYYKKKSVSLLKEGKTPEEVERYFLWNILPRVGEFLDQKS